MESLDTIFIFRSSTIPNNLKKKVFDACNLLVAIYGLETVALILGSANRLWVYQRAIERDTEIPRARVSLRDKIRNDEMRDLG